MSIPAHFDRNTTGEEVAKLYADDIKGKNVLITGCSPTALGAEMARIIALQQPGLLVITGRNQQPLDETKNAILADAPDANVRALILDLADFDQVRKAAAEVNAYKEKIDVIIASAGLMAAPLSYLPFPNNHIESQFGVNHLGHLLFTNLLLASIPRPADVRVVVVASYGHNLLRSPAKGINLEHPGFLHPGDVGEGNAEDGYEKWEGYAQSKTANILFAGGLKRRGWQAVSVHPGEIYGTGLLKHLDRDAQRAVGFIDESGELLDNGTWVWKTLSQGVSTPLLAAFAPWSALSGPSQEDAIYLVDCQITSQAEHAKGKEAEDKLWELSERMVGQTFVL